MYLRLKYKPFRGYGYQFYGPVHEPDMGHFNTFELDPLVCRVTLYLSLQLSQQPREPNFSVHEPDKPQIQ